MARPNIGFASAAFLILNIAAGVAGASAAESGPYLGISAGTATVDAGTHAQNQVDDLVASGFSSATVSLDRKSTGFKFLGGYQVNKNYAVEGFYADLGTYNFALTTTGPFRTGTGDARVSAYGVDLLGMFPINQSLDVFGRFGMYRRDAKSSFVTSDASFGSVPSISTNAKFGLGVDWNVTAAVALRTEWEYYDDKDAPITKLSVGIVSHF